MNEPSEFTDEENAEFFAAMGKINDKRVSRAKELFQLFVSLGIPALDEGLEDVTPEAHFEKLRNFSAKCDEIDSSIKKYLNCETIGIFIDVVLDNHNSARQAAMALKRHASDPKQQDKIMVRECWDAWQLKPESYKGKAAFARDMRDKFPSLESQPVIERWCREWEAQKVTQQAK